MINFILTSILFGSLSLSAYAEFAPKSLIPKPKEALVDISILAANTEYMINVASDEDDKKIEKHLQLKAKLAAINNTHKNQAQQNSQSNSSNYKMERVCNNYQTQLSEFCSSSEIGCYGNTRQVMKTMENCQMVRVPN